MHTITLGVENGIVDKFKWFLQHFEKEIEVLEEKELSDDEYLRNIDGIVVSILQAKSEQMELAVTEDKLDWYVDSLRMKSNIQKNKAVL